MTRLPRCLVDDVDADAPAVPDDGRRHLERSLRVRDGDLVELVDGRGGRARAQWRRGASPHVVERAPRAAPPEASITLGVGAPRLPRLEWLVEKAAEFGVAEVVPVTLRFAERTPGDGRLDRLRRKAASALVQSGGLHATRIAPPTDLAELLARDWGSIWFGAPPDDAVDDAVEGAAPRPPHLVVVGPEGGLADDEFAALEARGGRPVSLGPNVLRVETAAIALVALSYARA